MKGEIIEQTFGQEVIQGHLGGCSIGGDVATYYPFVWEKLVETFNVKSVVDIGCGIGYASKYFKSIGCDITAIDGSTQVGDLSLVPESFLLHDYENGGSALTNKDEIFDLCWSCEFVEHVEERHSQNFINDFKKCRYVAMTYAYPGQTGHHHVNEQVGEYWIQKLENNGFRYLVEETEQFKNYAQVDVDERMVKNDINPHLIIDSKYAHFMHRGLVFKNLEI